MEGGGGSEEVWRVGKRYGSGLIWEAEVEDDEKEEERKKKREKREVAKIM
jgi:hypothetical protein